MKIKSGGWLLAAIMLVLSATNRLEAATKSTITRTYFNETEGKKNIAKTVSTGHLVFLSGVEGIDPENAPSDGLAQIDLAVKKANEALTEVGLDIGAMIKHTIFIKDKAVNPMMAIQRFHAATRKYAPGLKERPCVGTIVRLPAFSDERVLAVLDITAAVPEEKGKPDTFKRVPFEFPMDVVKTVAVGNLYFTAGMEAFDFKTYKMPADIDGQIEVIVEKIDTALKASGLSIGNMVQHNLYVQKGTDPLHVTSKFNEASQRLAPELKDKPSTETLVVLDGMVMDTFKLEVDAIAAAPAESGKPDSFVRVPFATTASGKSKSISVGNQVYLSQITATDDDKSTAAPLEINTQVELTAKQLDNTLKKSGLSAECLFKTVLYVKKGAGDINQIVNRFNETLFNLAPELRKAPFAQTVVISEGLVTEDLLFAADAVAVF